jgi:hypothetical protein
VKPFVLLFVLWLAWPVEAANLKSTILQTGNQPCDAVQRDWYWNNATGGNAYLRKLWLWQGVDRGAIVDLNATIYASHPPYDPVPQVLLAHAWDHYAEPTGPHHVEISFAPDYILMRAGEWVTLRTSCANVGKVGAPRHGQTLVIYFTTEVP